MLSKYRSIAIVCVDGEVFVRTYDKPHTMKELKRYNERYIKGEYYDRIDYIEYRPYAEGGKN